MTSVKLDAGTFVRRILKRMKAFRSAESDGIPGYLTQVPIPDDQLVLGVYENRTGLLAEAIVVTDKSLWVSVTATIEEIRYDDIVSATWSPENKREANAVCITLRDLTTKLVPVRGEQRGGRDAFEFVRFLSRVIDRVDQARNSGV